MMNAALRIFRKDARRLWPQSVVASVAMALDAINNVMHPNGHAMWQTYLQMLTPLAVWVLTIAAVHEERLVGNNQYWLARPYSWKTLVAAKALFLAAFISLPLLVFQTVAIAMAGLSPLDWVSALLWRQVFIFIFFILPAVAMGAVTKNIGQVVIAFIVAFLGLMSAQPLVSHFRPQDWGNLGWIRQCGVALVMLAGTATVIAFQYARRRTVIAALLLGGVFALCIATVEAPVWGGAFHIQELFSREPALGAGPRVELDQSRIGSRPMEYGRASSDPQGVRLEIPLRVDIPSGLLLGAQWHSVSVEGPQGMWRSGWLTFQAFHAFSGSNAWLTVYVPPDFYDANQDTPVHLSGTLDLALFRRVAKIPASDNSQFQRVGVCVSTFGLARCEAPSRKFAISVDQKSQIDFAPLAPIPMEVSFQAIDEVVLWQWTEPATRDLYISRPVAYVQRSFEARDVRLEKLRLPTP